jgi:hypothetical protein
MISKRICKKGVVSTPIHVRFWKHFQSDANGCWEWQGALSAAGYGRIVRPGSAATSAPAHRVSWELHNGPIPDGLCVCHKCDNRKCVRPDHLFLGTQGDNNRDRDAKGRSRGGNSDKTHCKNGHEFTPDNIYTRANGGRLCRLCTCAYVRARRRAA